MPSAYLEVLIPCTVDRLFRYSNESLFFIRNNSKYLIIDDFQSILT